MIQRSFKISWHPHPTIYPWEEVSVRVREHPHEERTPSAVVSCPVEERQRCPDEQTKYPRVWAKDHHYRANHAISQGKNGSSIQLDHTWRRLPLCGGILQFWTTKQSRAESTFEWKGKARHRDRFSELTFTGNHNIHVHLSGFFVSNSYWIVISERFSYHPDGKFRLSWDSFRSWHKTSIT